MNVSEFEDSPVFWIGTIILFLGMVGLGFYMASQGMRSDRSSEMSQEEVKVYKLNKRGLKELRSGNYQQAIRIFQRSLRFQKGAFVSRYNLAFAHYRLGQHNPAIRHVRKAIELRNDSAKAHHLEGLILKKKRRYDSAVQAFERALEIEPDKEISYFHLGKTYQRQGRYKEAIESFEKGIDLTPNTEIEPQVFAHLAGAYFQTKDYREALDAFDEAIQNSQGIPQDYHLRRAYLNFGLENYQEAAEDAKTFLRNSEGSTSNHVYALILQYLSSQYLDDRRRQGVLAETSVEEQYSGWPKPILDYLQGKLSESKLLRRANSRGKRTEARYYSCIQNVFSGGLEKAREHCEWVTDNGRKEYYEYHLAELQLDRIK